MCEVLEECHDIVRASENVSIPPSVDRALHICLDRYTNLMALVERLRIDKLESRSLFTKWHQIVTEPERKAAFDAFRNSVMLLRDLCSEYVVACRCPVALQADIYALLVFDCGNSSLT